MGRLSSGKRRVVGASAAAVTLPLNPYFESAFTTLANVTLNLAKSSVQSNELILGLTRKRKQYHTGNASLVLSGGFGASGAAAQVVLSSGFIFGAGNSVPNYASGGNTTVSASLPGGLGVSITTNSGGLTGKPLDLNPGGATTVQAGYAVGLVNRLGGFNSGPGAVFFSAIDLALTAFQNGCN